MKSKAMPLMPQFVTLLLVAGVSLGKDAVCPPPKDISPCTCSQSAATGVAVQVVCSKVDNVAKVQKALQSLKGMQGLSVKFESCMFSLVPSDLFKGLHVTRVFFQSCNLKGIGNKGRSALEGLEDTVEMFQISFNEDNELRLPNVSSLHKLEVLRVEFSDIKQLGSEWFADGPANIKQLHLAGNKIERLGDKAFTQLNAIEELWLGHNKARTLARSMFPSPALHLKVLHIRDNEISNLPVDIFSNMPALQNIFLEENLLRRLPEATWKLVWSQLVVLTLEGNPLECDSHIDWMFEQSRPQILSGSCDLKKIIDVNHADLLEEAVNELFVK